MSFGIRIESRDDNDLVNGQICLHWNGKYKFIKCDLVKPKIEVVNTTYLEKPFSYKVYIQRTFGFYIGENSLHLYRGIMTDDSETDTTTVWFFPWGEWNHIRTSILNYDSSFFADIENKERGINCDYDQANQLREKSNYILVQFCDFDGIYATAKITVEEMEWERGVGYFKWLRHIVKNLVIRRINVEYDREVGPGKGSYKGGKLSSSFAFDRNEHVFLAFLEYAKKEKFTNVIILDNK